jgi:segregation and condensation protein B
MTRTESIIESLLFASDRPLTTSTIRDLLKDIDIRGIEQALESLVNRYEQGGHSFQILKLAGGYQICSRSEYAPWIQELFSSRTRSRLSRAALETLAIIAYRQPILRAEIEVLRGVRADAVLQTLLERNLIAVKGRKATMGRPLLYGTTAEFLRYFGLNEISDLPVEGELRSLTTTSKSAEGLVTEYEGEVEQILSPARRDIQTSCRPIHPGGASSD